MGSREENEDSLLRLIEQVVEKLKKEMMSYEI